MRFELLPVIDLMTDLYQKPRSLDRFHEYIGILQGNTKADLAVPITGFNPMAKEHVLEKLDELKSLGAENIIQQTLSDINNDLEDSDNLVFKLALNLSDDLKGGWTNRFTSDYDNKFKINAFVKRRFCTAVFWTSENYSPTLIKKRAAESVYRTLYWLKKPNPKTLREHVAQEIEVMYNSGQTTKGTMEDCELLNSFYDKHADTEDYHIIFNFLYGDKAAKSLEFPVFGVRGEMPGFGFCKQVAEG